ncbi:MAG: FkbM family methyltransferase [Phycisphaeraceae bacterium]
MNSATNIPTLPEKLNFLTPLAWEELIRVGNANDGGYLIPESIVKQTRFLVSMGVCLDWSFEEDFLRIVPGIGVHAYDHTVSVWTIRRFALFGVIKCLIGKSSFHEVRRRMRVLKSYGEFFTKQATHYQERICDKAQFNFDATADRVMERAQTNNVFIKMDIEGWEYQVIDDILKHSERIIGLAVEFHDTMSRRSAFIQAVEKLLEKYQIAHIHGNNWSPVGDDGLPDVLELTFVRNDKSDTACRRIEFPIPQLDQPNNPDLSDYAFRFNLHS